MFTIISRPETAPSGAPQPTTTTTAGKSSWTRS